MAGNLFRVGFCTESLAIGDLHVENFGTWRDKEGRLIWGVDDFDEAYSLPYTHDLVRLAASAEIADATDICTSSPRKPVMKY